MVEVSVIQGDCLTILDQLQDRNFDLVYLDPPFFTQKHHTLSTRDGGTTYGFGDVWASSHEYAAFLRERLRKCHTVLSESGSLFFHCDRNSSHIARWVLDAIFGSDMFQSEIIWSYKRWSSSQRALTPAHQTILFYSRTKNFKFHRVMTDYSETTNIDQIIQRRGRDQRNKAVYARDDRGHVISNGAKKGVPMSDVWEVPYLNPKARERTGYPTQKPILLLERIVRLCTDEGDWVLDPFCGSGTALVASKLLHRNGIGIDVSSDAIALANRRLQSSVKTESTLLLRGRSAYLRGDSDVLAHLDGIDHFPVQRNRGIDAILKQDKNGAPCFVRVQREGESVSDAAAALSRAAREKGQALLIVVAVRERDLLPMLDTCQGVYVVPSAGIAIKALLDDEVRPYSSAVPAASPEPLVTEAMRLSGAKAKEGVIDSSLAELVRRRRIEELKAMAGMLDLDLDPEGPERLRTDEQGRHAAR